MSEAAQSAPQAETQPVGPINYRQGAEMLAQRRAAEANKPDPVSEAARTMGKAAADARAQARQAQAAAEALNASGEEPADDGNKLSGTAGDETATETELTPEIPDDGESKAIAVSDDLTLDLGEGVTMNGKELRDSILRQADYTRKTQSLAEEKKAWEGEASQKLSQMDQVIDAMVTKIGQPKSLSQLITETGDVAEAAKLFDAQNSQIQAIHAAQELKARQVNEYQRQKLENRDVTLANTYNPEWADSMKRDQAYTELSKYALTLGATADDLKFLPQPWMIQVIDKAMKYDAGESAKAKVVKAAASKPPVLKPGAQVSRASAAAGQIQEATAKLKSSGSIADAAAVLRARRGLR